MTDVITTNFNRRDVWGDLNFDINNMSTPFTQNNTVNIIKNSYTNLCIKPDN